MSNLHIIIAGGGTGGHIFPAVAIGHALQRLRPGTQLLFVGAKGKMEMEKVPKAGFEIIGLDIVGFNRSNMLKNLLLPYKLLMSRIAAKKILADFKPDVVVGVGGYASFPVLNAAQGEGIPTVLQEQNSWAGKSNKILGRKAKAICVAYKGMEQFFPQAVLKYTGNPVRKSISEMGRTKAEGLQYFGLTEGKQTLLIVGGSLGARSINEVIGAQIDEVLSMGVQVIWQTGKPYYETAQQQASGYEKLVKVHDFIADMDYAYAAADVVISRAGALAIAELCIAGKPVIFVPYPHAAEDHQTVNAMSLVKEGAAYMIPDAAQKEQLVSKLKELVNNNELQQAMAVQLKRLAIKDADEQIANEIIRIAALNK